jgi:hypothetical protein
MIRLVLEMPDAMYEKFKTGFRIGGLFEFSFNNLAQYGINIVDCKYCEDKK